MRFTVVDRDGALSFVGPCHALKALAAACSKRPPDHRALLALFEEYDPRFAGRLLAGLSRFDAGADPDHENEASPGDRDTAAAEGGPFRVVDEATRRRSLEPVRAGLVVFNLPAKRIVQVQNSYAELRRQDRGRLRRDGRPVRAYYSYELPLDWSIVP